MALLDRFRRTQKAEPARAETREIGRSGTVNMRGFLTSEERNAALVWPHNLEVFDEMARTDPTCKWSLALVTNPLLAADKEIEPATPSKEDHEVAGFVRHCLFDRLEDGFDDFLRRALMYLRYGHQVFERVAAFEPVQFSYENEAGDRVEVDREAFVVSRLAQRLARTIQKWNPDPKDPGRLESIEQWLMDGGDGESNPVIPADRLVIFVNEKEGDDWRGVSVLRSAYFPYKTKLKLENIEAIALERSAGLPVAYPPSGADDAQKTAMESALQSIRQGESLWVLMPGPKASTDNPDGWLLEELGIEGDAGRSPSEAIQRYEAAMARNVLAEFMRLGHENVGARATADVQQEPYWQILGAIGHYVEEVVNEQVIEPLVRWNYEVRDFPKFKLGKMQSRNVQVLAGAIANLLSKGGLTADPDLENYLRRILDAPELDPEDRERIEREKLERAQKFGTPGGTPDKPGSPAKPGAEPDPKDSDRDTDRDKPARMSERSYRRPLRPEETYVALSEVERGLDDGADDLVQAAEEAVRGPAAALRAQIDSAVRIKSADLIAKLELDPAPVARALEDVLARSYDAGRSQVRAELRRQGVGARMAEEPDEGPSQIELFAAKAAAIAAVVAGAATRALRTFGLRMLEDGAAQADAVGFEPLAAARAEARRAAPSAVNGAWAAGRRAEQLERRMEIREAIYSAILDDHTCPPCSEADGRMGPPGGDPALPCPNPNCHGGGACRCMWIAIAKEEAVRLPIAATEHAAEQLHVHMGENTPSAPEVHVHIDQGAFQATTEVHVPEQPVTVNVPESKPPDVKVSAPVSVTVPEQPPPEVKVEGAEVEVNVPDRKKRLVVKRDAEGRIDEIREQ
jgi:hypothetical protein